MTVKRRAEGLVYEGEKFVNLDLRSMKGFGTKFTGCTFDGCQLDLADLRSTRFTDCTFRNCTIRLVNFGASVFEGTKFIACDMEQASFMGCSFRDGGFEDCRMAYGETLFLDATIRGQMEIAGCNLHGSNLDFRQVEPTSLRFLDCNFWSARVSLGCAFWNATFDEKAIRQFLGLMARASQDSRLKELAGDQYRVICRAMDGRKGAAAGLVAVEVEDKDVHNVSAG